ncbi:hypothetical protein B5807_11362 [Epicoccum nigrum]|uniref:Uncharacterized protein n=1 Tax=Epicoccum nigrum TaxID=105696 RepID=A0A1Y2LJZ6_EPING|nr:hypothetical protein B5807_11362 [Epicoccum nigrum]
MKLLLFILPVAVSLSWGGVQPRAQFRMAVDSSVVPDRYLVSLKIGHTLSEHWETIGQDLSKDGEDFRYMETINVYSVTLRDEYIVHNTIRTDPQVEDVEMDYYISFPEFESEEYYAIDHPNSTV